MPMMIDHIDAIARKKQRDVLLIAFYPDNQTDEKPNPWGAYDIFGDYDFERDTRRKDFLKWLKDHNIRWQICGLPANEFVIFPYFGTIYIDVPYDENDPQYQLVRDYLENPDGSMRDNRVCFFYLPLDVAMQNAQHDEPGFWDKWAETF